MIAAEAPIAQYFDTDGTPLTYGYLYFGTANQNPETSPVTMYWDAAGTQPAAQPIRTLNGYTVRNGIAAVVFGPSDYSLTVRNSKGVMLLYVASAATVSNGAINANAIAQLIADLANKTTVGKGADQLGLNLTGAGEVDTNVGPYLNLMVKGLKRNFGCALDGVADDYAKLANALTATGKTIEHEGGTCLFNSTLPTPSCAAIVGQSDLVSFFQTGVGLTRGFSLGGANYPRVLQNFQMKGTSAVNAIGIYLGEVGSNAVKMFNVRVSGFNGSGGVGIRVGDTLKSELELLTCEGNEIGLLVQYATPGFPTTTHMLSCVMTDNTLYGMKVRDSDIVILENVAIDSSGQEGLFVDSSSSRTITDLILTHCRFEGNYGNSNTQFHVRIGTNSGSGTIRPKIEDCYFDTRSDGARAKSIVFDGGEVAGFDLEGYRAGGTYAQAVSILNGAYGRTDGWLPAFDYRTVVYDPLGNDFGPYGHSRDLTGLTTIASESGNAAATFSAGPSVNLARYKVEGRWIDLDLDISGTLNAVTPRYFTVALPAGYTLVRSTGVGCRVSDAGSSVAGWLEMDAGSNTARFWRADGAAFTSAGAIGLRGRIRGELT